MRIDITKAEFECIVDALKGVHLKATRRLREELITRWTTHVERPNGWAPIKPSIRSSWPSGHVKADKKSHWSFKGGSKPKVSKPKAPPPTADDILASL